MKCEAPLMAREKIGRLANASKIKGSIHYTATLSGWRSGRDDPLSGWKIFELRKIDVSSIAERSVEEVREKSQDPKVHGRYQPVNSNFFLAI
jgi:hypothetical protein